MTLTRADHIQRLHDLSLCLNNEDSLGWEAEADNLEADRPAYWYRGQSSPAATIVELSRCEEHNFSLLKAAEVFADRHPHADQLAAYDAIIPLNEAAVRELSLCYRLQSTFREDDELRDREREAIFNPVFFPRMRQDMRDEWQRLYEGAQQRWADRRDAEFAMAAPHRPAPLMKPTCDEAGNWRYVPAAEIDGARVPAAAVAAVNLDQTLLDTVASALDIPADPARAAVEGARLSEVA